jgi:pimeloyl-ACP methyl ester carboxylesterase
MLMILKQVVVNGLLARYGRKGKGKTILLLHGWGDSLATFHELADKLSANYEVIAVDLPGFGQTQPPPQAWGLEEYAEFVQAFLKKIDAPKVYAIAGHSNGGAIALQLLSGQPIAEKLILLASAGIRNRDKAKKQLLRAGAKTAKILSVALPKATRQRLRNRLYGVIGSDMAAVPHMEETFKRIVAQDIINAARRVNIPTLLIYGSDDEATPPQYGEKLAYALPNSHLEVIKGAGHFIHHDSVAKVYKLSEEFLQ